jgi:SAM-dependent methyltransferase
MMSCLEIIEPEHHPRYARSLARYRSGTWRDRIMHDLIIEDAQLLNRPCTFLDIGCGKGFDDDLPLQVSLSNHASRYIGVEPDQQVALGPHFTDSYRCLFEQAPIPSASVDIAFAIMVIEHLSEPQKFWDKVRDVLVPGGVFWGLTIDNRHPFAKFSLLAEKLRIKDIYMRMLMGERGEERYLNYPVYYRSNSPLQVCSYLQSFQSSEVINFSREDQLEAAFPRRLRPVVRAYDRWGMARGKPGTLLAIRAVK